MPTTTALQQDQTARVSAAFADVPGTHDHAGLRVRWTERSAHGTFTTLLFPHLPDTRPDPDFTWPTIPDATPDRIYSTHSNDSSTVTDAHARIVAHYVPPPNGPGNVFTLDLTEQVLITAVLQHLPEGDLHAEITVPERHGRSGTVTTLTHRRGTEHTFLTVRRTGITVRPTGIAAAWDTFGEAYLAAPDRRTLLLSRPATYTVPTAAQSALFHDMNRLLGEMGPRTHHTRARVYLKHDSGSSIDWIHGTSRHLAENGRDHSPDAVRARRQTELRDTPHLDTGWVTLSRTGRVAICTARLNLRLHQELCLLLQRLALAWQDDSLTRLMWTNDRRHDRAVFTPLGGKQVLVKYTSGHHLNRNPRPVTEPESDPHAHATVLNVHDLIGPLTRAARAYLQDTLAP